MRMKRSFILITCSLLLIILATACSSTTGTTPTTSTTTQQTTNQTNGTTQLNNQNKRDDQASVQVTPIPSKTTTESKMGNDQDDQGNKGSSWSIVQGATISAATTAKSNQNDSSSSDDEKSNSKDQGTSKPVVYNSSGPVAAPTTTTSRGTMYITTRVVTINGTAMNVLATGDGKTLYYRTSDPAPASTCTGNCAATWPPLLNNNMQIITSQKLNGTLTVSRTANGSQVLYNGHPLYTYVGDNAVGQANGQGSGGVWFVVQVQRQKMHW